MLEIVKDCLEAQSRDEARNSGNRIHIFIIQLSLPGFWNGGNWAGSEDW